jgi:anaerobic magnesium-protoporphyrin IX monomethyl ester cyclase
MKPVDYKRVLLVNPAINGKEKYGKLASMLLTPSVPFSIISLGSFLEKHSVEVRLFDEQIELLNEQKLQTLINDFKPGIIGLSCTTAGIYRAHEIAKNIKEISREIKVVMGNIHPTVMPDETLGDCNVDLVVRQEGEITFLEYILALDHSGSYGNIVGLSYRENGKAIHNPDRAYVKKLDFFPKLNWDLLVETKGNYSIEWVLSSRGCPYHCIFCSARSVSGFHYRMNSPNRVLEEVETVVQAYGKRFFSFADDNFVVNKKRTRQICEMLIERGYSNHVKWLCQTRADAVNENILELMRKAGCEYISFGIETGTQRMLDLIRKNVKIETIAKAVRMAHATGIKTRGSFMLGLPAETREDSLATIKFALELPLDAAKFNMAVPYPGTKLLAIAMLEGFQVTNDWSKLNTAAGLGNSQAFYIPQGRTIKELAKLQKRAHIKFYMRPKQIWRTLRRENIDFNLPKIKSAGQLVQLAVAIIQFFWQSVKK